MSQQNGIEHAVHPLTRRLKGSLDRPKTIIARDCGALIEGWVLAHDEAIETVIIHAGSEQIGVAIYGRSRPDVALSHREHPQGLASGFRFDWREIPPSAPAELSISVQAITASGSGFLPASVMRVYDTLHQAAQALTTDFATSWQPWLEVAKQHQALGNVAEAVSILRQACEVWPDVPKVALRYSELAVRQNLFAEARSALQRSLSAATAPEVKLISARLVRIDQAAQACETEVDHHAATPVEPGTSPDGSLNSSDDMKVLSSFESLGFNCEFGFAQRFFDVEPISLLRFGYAPLHLLVKGLSERFDGVGQPENTVLKPTWGTEYGVSDTRYNLQTHTEVHTTSGIDASRLLLKQCQRLRFLTRKLLEDLEISDKIFVFQRYERLSDDEVLILADRLAVYRKTNRLLCVRLADRDHPPASIEWLGDFTAVGYIAKFSNWQNVGRNLSRLPGLSCAAPRWARLMRGMWTLRATLMWRAP